MGRIGKITSFIPRIEDSISAPRTEKDITLFMCDNICRINALCRNSKINKICIHTGYAVYIY
ncbi:MAG: hypothetical protein ACD_78C00447G0001, partial [uncultured bacterium (gcode 4)]